MFSSGCIFFSHYNNIYPIDNFHSFGYSFTLASYNLHIPKILNFTIWVYQIRTLLCQDYFPHSKQYTQITKISNLGISPLLKFQTSIYPKLLIKQLGYITSPKVPNFNVPKVTNQATWVYHLS